jgi:gluconate 5-dehydrogenase
VFNVTVRALFFLSQRVARHMVDKGGGSIVNVASVSGFTGSREDIQAVVAYNASKGAVITLTKDLAVKLAPHAIRVNAIAPGPFLTDMMNYVSHDETLLAEFHRAVPMNRSGVEDDIKGVAVFLAGDASAFVTGHTLVVDGGVMAVDPWPSR